MVKKGKVLHRYRLIIRKRFAYSPTNADMFAGLMDYAKEKLETPPLLRVEQNLLQLHKQVGLLATQVARLVRMDALDAVSAGEVTAEVQETLDALQSISTSTLHPIRAERYTIIKNKEDSKNTKNAKKP